ncbi:uncharacterized protein LOC108342362 isoform X1 [Vigna angularis]|uniref:uncharacterized protein LOC108342362 isoform X1 n=1 Tax=Phaseolus angularis TaxID=3914 RepID=UPI000809F7CE|nr:uncharacterized protein LOC108342362 isoform X1 [Vigna angularis]
MMIHVLFFVLHFLSTHLCLKVEGTQTILKKDLELERQLRLINKPPLKSIYTKFGDIIDCIDIYKQPSLDHPLLKDHKLQRKPNFHNVIGESSEKNLGIKSMFELSKDECPKGTVPIFRTTKDDLIREQSMLNDHILIKDLPGVHLAEISLRPSYAPFYGVAGINSIYNPRVDSKFQISMTHVWVEKGTVESNNKISLGWHVAPGIYGDYDSHFYTSWTTDNYNKTGCYNIRCPGFVQTSKKIYLGQRITNTSICGGQTIDSFLAISQDTKSKNWWIIINNKFIGYFPAKLFSNMSTADHVGWGGRTKTRPSTDSPQMGSGHLPNDTACYFRQMWFKDPSAVARGPKSNQVYPLVDKPTCYDIKNYGDKGGHNGYYFEFGGPGGSCGD